MPTTCQGLFPVKGDCTRLYSIRRRQTNRLKTNTQVMITAMERNKAGKN